MQGFLVTGASGAFLIAALLSGTAARAVPLQDATRYADCDAPSEEDDASVEARLLALYDKDATADPAASIASAQALLDAIPDSACAEAKAAGLAVRGTGYFYLERLDEAQADFDSAQEILVAAGQGDGQMAMDITNFLASTYAARGELDRALAAKNALLARVEAMHGTNSPEYADVLYGTGFVYYRMGQVEEALDRIHRAADIMREQRGDSADPNMAIYLMSESAILLQIGRLAEGLDRGREAASWAEDHLGADHLVTAAALHSYGSALNNVGRYAEAGPILRRTLAIRERLVGVDHPDVALTLNNLAYTEEHLGDGPTALEMYLTAADIFEAHPDASAPQSAGMMVMNAANIALSSGDWEAVDTLGARALALVEARVGTDNRLFLRTATLVASGRIHTGDYAGAQTVLDQAIAAIREELEPYEANLVRAEVLAGLAQLRGGDTTGGLEKGMDAYRRITAHMRDQTVADFARIRIEENYSDTLQLFAQLALEAGDSETAFEAMQMARLGDLERSGRQVAARQAATNETTADAVRELQELIAEVAQWQTKLTAAVGSSDVAARHEAEAKLAALEQRIETLRAQVTAAFPAYAELNRPSTATIEMVQARLDGDTVVVLTQPGLEGILTVAITRDAIAWHFAPKLRNEFMDAVTAIREGVEDSSRPFPVDQAHLLYAAVFGGDIAPLLEGKTNLDVLSGGYLSVIPFSLLVEQAPEPGAALSDTAWLIRRLAISTPIDLAGIGETSANATRPVRFAGFGDPALAPAKPAEAELATLVRGSDVTLEELRELPSLPGAGEELAAMAQTLDNPDNMLLTGMQATETAVRSADLTPFTVIAFATHGLVGGQLGGLDEPALVMTPPNSVMEDDDGLLTASEIARLRLNADWVILSACNTAAGAKAGTPTYSGLAQAFVFAGARSLLLSHWRVRDDAASRLSVGTVRGAAQGLDKAEALREAQLDLMADPDVPDAAHPAVWAPFILIES